MTQGEVRVWDDDEGWGVIDSDATPGGCWAHYSAVVMPGFKTLSPGHRVTFKFETAEQDGFSYRAVKVVPASARGYNPEPLSPPVVVDPGFSQFAHLFDEGAYSVECGDGQEVYKTVSLMPPDVGSPTAIEAVQAVEQRPHLKAVEVSAEEVRVEVYKRGTRAPVRIYLVRLSPTGWVARVYGDCRKRR